VLLVITLAEVGGAQRYVASLLTALVDRFDVVVAAHGQGPLREAAEQAGVPFVPLRHVRRPIRPWRDLAGLVELFLLFRRERPDIVHLNSSKAGLLGRLAASAAKVPIRIFTVHGWAFAAHSGIASRFYRWADALVAPLTTVVVCVSEHDRRAGLRAGTCTEARSLVIRNGISMAEVSRSGHHLRARPRLVSVGRLQAPKDFTTLVRALAHLPPNAYEALIVGDGPGRAKLEDEARRLGLEGQAAFVGERADVPSLLGASDVFVLSSRSESLPVSVLEAMAAELPVVASRVGGVPELVVDGRTGFLVQPGDPMELAAALGRLLADPDLRRRLGAVGRVRAETRFGVEPFRRAHVELYVSELARRKLPVPHGLPTLVRS
jgi:glycosyltransferase involved in cell wall biosynthesis